MLKEEIDKLNDINQLDNFLENTRCGYVLEELRKNPEIQIFFKNIILKTVEKIEKNYSFKEIKLDILELTNEINKLKETEEKKLEEENDININQNNQIEIGNHNIRKNNNKENIKENEQAKIFIKKYIPDITNKELEKIIENSQKENKNNLFEYFDKLKNDIKLSNDPDVYSNKKIISKIFCSNSNDIFSLYQKDFLIIVQLIEQLINDLIENIYMLPNSVKYICKIISILIKNKFKDITIIEENAFISKFILEKLLIPIISFPSYNALITDFIISENTIKNIKLINVILQKFFSGKLFKNNEEEYIYSPFNWLFLEKMENIILFFEKAKNAKLPNFIEKYANNELSKDYIYDYFNENNEKICENISICFTIDNLYYLVKGLDNNNKDIFNNKSPFVKILLKSLEKLKTEKTKNEIKSIDENKKNIYKENLKNSGKNTNKTQQIENFYIYNNQIVEKKYENLFLIKNSNNIFNNGLKGVNKNQIIEEKQNYIIKVKNYLFSALGNCRILNESDFNIESTSNLTKMLKEMKKYSLLPNFNLNNNSIPFVWYINAILEYLNKIPEDYKKYNFKKLFKELNQNLTDSINSLDFGKLIIFKNKLKILDKIKNYYDNIKKIINNFRINENIKNIFEDAFIPIDMSFEYDDNEKKFDLIKSKNKEKIFGDKNIYQDLNTKTSSFKTIKSFVENFPNLSNIQGKNPFNVMKELSINNKINNYFNIIKELLTQKGGISINQYSTLYESKIKDYIMNKIYEKIYPQE